MKNVKYKWIALSMGVLFIIFAAGYYLGQRVRAGTYIIDTFAIPEKNMPAPLQTAEASDGASTEELPSGTPEAPPLININKADAEELADIPGIGPVLAGRIVTYREEHGPFADLEALTGVAGIGDKTIENMRPYIVT